MPESGALSPAWRSLNSVAASVEPPRLATTPDTAPASAEAAEESSTPPSSAAAATSTIAGAEWLPHLEREARTLLEAGSPEVWEALTRQFEARLIRTALEVTRGRRIEAAQKLGIARNTITRKIQELGLDD